MTVALPPFCAAAPGFGTALAMRTLVEYLIYLGAIILVTVIVALWIAASRQPLERHRREHHQHSLRRWLRRAFGRSHARKRRRRREHRKRNPTLAETGGLPPIRSEAAPPAESPQP